MRILITNDDGINARGLAVLHRIAEALAGPEGEVWTVAPAFEQSGVAHSTSHARPILVSELGPRRWATEGSPADCVMAALHDVMAEAPPDLVLSGVNRGNNAAENAAYSGTLGAAMEAALQGLPAIALSQYFGPALRGLDDPFEASAVHCEAVVRALLDKGDWGARHGYRIFYNVNVPPLPAADVRGVRAVAQGIRDGIVHGMVPALSPSGRRFLWVKGGGQDVPSAPGTDAQACLEGYIAVTPMRADFTDHASLEALRAALA